VLVLDRHARLAPARKTPAANCQHMRRSAARSDRKRTPPSCKLAKVWQTETTGAAQPAQHTAPCQQYCGTTAQPNHGMAPRCAAPNIPLDTFNNTQQQANAPHTATGGGGVSGVQLSSSSTRHPVLLAAPFVHIPGCAPAKRSYRSGPHLFGAAGAKRENIQANLAVPKSCHNPSAPPLPISSALPLRMGTSSRAAAHPLALPGQAAELCRKAPQGGATLTWPCNTWASVLLGQESTHKSCQTNTTCKRRNCDRLAMGLRKPQPCTACTARPTGSGPIHPANHQPPQTFCRQPCFSPRLLLQLSVAKLSPHSQAARPSSTCRQNDEARL
jgi:hypothetical protein